jgi:alkylation response protein AidB-like acyl-CoA dehydrogenase
MNFDLNEEQRMWREVVHDFSTRQVRPAAHQMDEEATFNWEAARKMGALGLLGLNIPEEYGGAGLDALSAAIAIEELGWGCGGTGLAIAAHNGLGCAALALFASDELKEQILPTAASGRRGLAAMALTEPGAGSDLQGGVRTRAERVGDDWVINGSKAWCTNACLADFIVTLVRTDPAGGSHSLSLIIVPTTAPGLIIGPAEKKMGMRASPANPVTYEQVRVPYDYLLGQPGQGLAQSMEVLDGGRIGIGALAIGIAQAALEAALAYARERQAFGGPIAEKEAVQWMLADAATEIQAARLLIYQAACVKASGKRFTLQAAMAKLFASETAERVCRNAIQIFGGYGYSSEYPVERYYRDARLLTIGEGTSEIQRMVIARNILK